MDGGAPADKKAAGDELAGDVDASLNAFFDHAVPVSFLPRVVLGYGRALKIPLFLGLGSCRG
jgi:hypothetical protein